MLQTAVLVAHVAIAVAIVGLVLLQRGKGAEAGTGFGAGASGTVFGARGSANFLTRSTAVLATLFFASSLGLAYLGGQRSAPTSVLDETPSEVQEPAPAAAPLPTVEPGLDELPDIDQPAAPVDEPGEEEQ